MKTRQLTVFMLLLTGAAALAWALFTPATSVAQAQGPSGQGIRIAVASTGKIFTGVKERTDIKARLDQQGRDLQGQEASKRQKLKDMQSELELIKPDAPQYEEKIDALTQATAEFKVWGESNQAKAARFEKQQTKMLFDKITVAIAEIAKEKGIDLVIAEPPTVNLDRMSSAELMQLMVQRQVLFANAGLDITADVIARMDQQYNAQKK
jgi:Skp family chaperone for outer membrane proteins